MVVVTYCAVGMNERTIPFLLLCLYIYACKLSALENRHFEIYTIVIISEKFVDLCMYVRTHMFI
jgi:hypothetical protein